MLPPNQPRAIFKLPWYAGTVPPEPYLSQVRLAPLQNGWITEETAAHMALALEGKALQVLLDLMPAQHWHYVTLAGAQNQRFGKRIWTESMCDQLIHHCRRNGKNLGAYAADMHIYTQRGYPTFNPATRKELAVDKFIQGFTPEWLKEHLHVMAPMTLNGSLEEAERVEAVLTPHNPLRHQVWQAETSSARLAVTLL